MYDNWEEFIDEYQDEYQDEIYERESRYGSDLVSHMPNYNGGTRYDFCRKS